VRPGERRQRSGDSYDLVWIDHQIQNLVPWADVAPRMARQRPRRLIIPLILQTIRRDPSGSDQIDEACNLSRPDPSGPDQIDVEHQATDLAVGVQIPRGAPCNASAALLSLRWSPWIIVASAAAASSRLDRHPAVAFVVGAMVGRVRVPAAADLEDVAILALGWTPGRRQVVAECVTALGGDADSLGNLLGDPPPGVALCLAQLHPVHGRAGQSASNQVW
jgi:hypothetical protein